MAVGLALARPLSSLLVRPASRVGRVDHGAENDRVPHQEVWMLVISLYSL